MGTQLTSRRRRPPTTENPGQTEQTAPTMWLALAISLLFFAEAAWRFAIEGTSAPDRATAIFNGVNFVLFGLLGLGCLFWPTISSWFRPKEENDDVSVVVDSGAPAAATPAPAASPKQEKSLESLDVESGNVVAPAPAAAPKRKVTYLTNVKTFLTFIVVTFHTVCVLVPHRVRLRCVSSGWHADYADRCKQANSRSNEQFFLFLHRRIMVFDGEPRLLHGGLLFDICLLLSQELGPQGIQELLHRQACQVGRPLHPLLNAAGSNDESLVPGLCRGSLGVQLRSRSSLVHFVALELLHHLCCRGPVPAQGSVQHAAPSIVDRWCWTGAVRHLLRNGSCN